MIGGDAWAALTATARALGFADCGLAPVTVTPHHDHFLDWLAEGCAAEMDYLQRHRDIRADPRRLAPGARSVLVVTARHPRNPTPAAGGIAMFARGRDYHTVMRARLRVLAEHLRARHGARVARVCVDSAPLAERSWALAAGLGWRGRQGQLITPRHGACVLLGAIVTDLEPARPPAPHPSRCGSCRRCVLACPTGAIRADGSVDARRCLSYWSIESRRAPPSDIAARWDGTLFGCDRCTAVCPWNRFGADAAWPEFQSDQSAVVRDCAPLDEAAFAQRYAHTALARGGFARWQRNASLAGASLIPQPAPASAPARN